MSAFNDPADLASLEAAIATAGDAVRDAKSRKASADELAPLIAALVSSKAAFTAAGGVLPDAKKSSKKSSAGGGPGPTGPSDQPATSAKKDAKRTAKEQRKAANGAGEKRTLAACWRPAPHAAPPRRHKLDC